MFRRGILVCCLFGPIGCAPMLTALPDDPRLLRNAPETSISEPPPPQRLAQAPAAGPPTPRRPEAPPEANLPTPTQVASAETAPQAPDPDGTAVAVSTPPAALTPAPRDSEIVPTKSAAAGDPADKLATLTENPGEPVTEVVAHVGDSIVTMRELKRAIRDRMQSGQAWNQLPRAEKNQHGREILEYLIDRQMLIQEARRELKKPKQWDTLKEMMGKGWTERELPALLRKAKAVDEVDLKQKLAEHGESLDEMRESFLLEEMARAYLGEKVRTKITQPDLPELYRYYRENEDRFQRPAQITWREIFLQTGGETTPEAPRARAEEIRRRLLAGEDFTALAKSVSQSPRARDGGRWQTTPGGFASAPVNQVLDTLPVGEVSPVIADPKGVYLVKIENRRPAGPAPFEEVQDQINEALMSGRFEKAMRAFLDKLQSSIVVTSPLFDGTPYAPRQSQARKVALLSNPKGS